MKAWIIRKPGGPEKFELEDLEVPSAKEGWALIRIRAFGLNRSEWFTRIGDSPTVKFPRVLGRDFLQRGHGRILRDDSLRRAQRWSISMARA